MYSGLKEIRALVPEEMRVTHHLFENATSVRFKVASFQVLLNHLQECATKHDGQGTAATCWSSSHRRRVKAVAGRY